MSEFRLDLVVLVADKDAAMAFRGLSPRHQSLGIRPVRFTVQQITGRDAATFRTGPEVARAYLRDAAHALVVLDRHGSGRDDHSPADIANDVRRRLAANGWDDRASCLVLDPELEQWVWSDSPHVAEALGWRGDLVVLRQRLEKEGAWAPGQAKPFDPKRAMQLALSWRSIAWSASIHGQLAEKVSLRRYKEPSMLALKELLQSWFPPCSAP